MSYNVCDMNTKAKYDFLFFIFLASEGGEKKKDKYDLILSILAFIN